jgi:hypothetical protein
MTAIVLSLAYLLSGASIDEAPTGDSNFDYYFGEFTTYEMKSDQPMGKLITERLAASMFDTTDEKTFRTRIQLLLNSEKENPDKTERYLKLDSYLSAQFESRLKEAKHKRLVYTAVGAVVGAVIAIPAGLMIGPKVTSMGTKVLLLTIPIGALAGAGAGFLLGNILAMPKYDYEPGVLSKDLKAYQNEIAEGGEQQ